jgi:hypothetical protein
MLLITQPRVGHSHNEIIALQMSARELGWDVVSAPSSWRLEDDLINSNAIGVPYGSQLFCEVIAQQMNWKLKMNSFDWLANVPKQYTNRQVDFMSLKEARLIKERKFIKPADDKCFDAKIYEIGTFDPSPLISDDYPVLVSDIVEFVVEYRCFVRERQMVTGSCYIYEDQIANPKYFDKYEMEAQLFMKDMLPNIQTEDAVIDIGLIKNSTWSVIETNPAWASGLYGCDPMEALLTIQNTVSRNENINYGSKV